jgi:hypothetical protein
MWKKFKITAPYYTFPLPSLPSLFHCLLSLFSCFLSLFSLPLPQFSPSSKVFQKINITRDMYSRYLYFLLLWCKIHWRTHRIGKIWVGNAQAFNCRLFLAPLPHTSPLSLHNAHCTGRLPGDKKGQRQGIKKDGWEGGWIKIRQQERGVDFLKHFIPTRDPHFPPTPFCS